MKTVEISIAAVGSDQTIDERQAVWTDELARVSSRLPWLTRPSLVKDEAEIPYFSVENEEGRIPSRYFDLRMWMILQYAGKLIDSAGIKHEEGRSLILGESLKGLSPGLDTLAEYHELAPKLAIPEGIDDKGHWGKLALSASKITDPLSVRGTKTLREFRRGVALPDYEQRLLFSANPKHFSLSGDKESLLFNHDVDEAIKQIQALDHVSSAGGLNARCPAHDAMIRLDRKSTIGRESQDTISVYRAFSLTYNDIATRLIYPTLDPNSLN